jgi:hypothetical protein
VDGGGEEASSANAEAVITVLPEGTDGPFRRGDADGGGTVDISDAILVLNWLFTGGNEPACGDAADADDGGGVDITDPLRVLGWLFSGAAEPPPPGPAACGLDPSADALAACAEGAGC